MEPPQSEFVKEINRFHQEFYPILVEAQDRLTSLFSATLDHIKVHEEITRVQGGKRNSSHPGLSSFYVRSKNMLIIETASFIKSLYKPGGFCGKMQNNRSILSRIKLKSYRENHRLRWAGRRPSNKTLIDRAERHAARSVTDISDQAYQQAFRRLFPGKQRPGMPQDPDFILLKDTFIKQFETVSGYRHSFAHPYDDDKNPPRKSLPPLSLFSLRKMLASIGKVLSDVELVGFSVCWSLPDFSSNWDGVVACLKAKRFL